MTNKKQKITKDNILAKSMKHLDYNELMYIINNGFAPPTIKAAQAEIKRREEILANRRTTKIKTFIKKITLVDVLEYLGTFAAMIASYLVASNTNPGVGYILYTISAVLIGYVVFKLKRMGLAFLQVYFIVINLIGIHTFLLN